LSYRKQLIAPERVQLVWLDVPEAELERRLSQRANHYMKLEMLRSQIAAFEPIQPEENAIIVDGLRSPVEVVTDLLNTANRLLPSLKKPWWQRCYE